MIVADRKIIVVFCNKYSRSPGREIPNIYGKEYLLISSEGRHRD
jgi:hypothetical protein